MTEGFIEISDGSKAVRLALAPAEGLWTANGTPIKGWWGTPDAKVDLTERQGADGAHAVLSDAVVYSARTVTIDFAAYSRSVALEAFAGLQAMAGRIVRVRVNAGGEDTYCDGYVETKLDDVVGAFASGTVTVVCPDPRRRSSEKRTAILLPSGTVAGAGLRYSQGLSYPLSYGEGATDARNVGVVENRGTAPAWPVVVARGPMPDGFRLDISGDGWASSVVYSAPVRGSVELDFLSRTARAGSIDATANASIAGWHSVPPGSWARFALQGGGAVGSAIVECRDTYI